MIYYHRREIEDITNIIFTLDILTGQVIYIPEVEKSKIMLHKVSR